MKQPRITVFIPTFNRLPLLKRAVASVLSQGEFIRLHILDNASSDGTADWLSELAKADGRVQITIRSKNVGALQNFVEGFDSVQTPYLVPLADDDELCSGFLQAALTIAQEHNSVGGVVFQTSCRNQDGEFALSPESMPHGKLTPREHLTYWAENGPYISWSSVLWVTKVVQSSQSVSRLLEFGLPSDVWFQFANFLSADVFLVARAGAAFNFHDGQAWRDISLLSLPQYYLLTDAIKQKLQETNILDVSLQNLLLTKLIITFNQLISQQNAEKSVEVTSEQLSDLLRLYLVHSFPHVGLKVFPFFELLPQTKALQKDLLLCRNLQKIASENIAQQSETIIHLNQELQLIRKSLSWRLTMPLRVVDSIVRRIASTVPHKR